jgi:hypothetical protein
MGLLLRSVFSALRLNFFPAVQFINLGCRRQAASQTIQGGANWASGLTGMLAGSRLTRTEHELSVQFCATGAAADQVEIVLMAVRCVRL